MQEKLVQKSDSYIGIFLSSYSDNWGCVRSSRLRTRKKPETNLGPTSEKHTHLQEVRHSLPTKYLCSCYPHQPNLPSQPNLPNLTQIPLPGHRQGREGLRHWAPRPRWLHDPPSSLPRVTMKCPNDWSGEEREYEEKSAPTPLSLFPRPDLVTPGDATGAPPLLLLQRSGIRGLEIDFTS
jgi:hypothetical protein